MALWTGKIRWRAYGFRLDSPNPPPPPPGYGHLDSSGFFRWKRLLFLSRRPLLRFVPRSPFHRTVARFDSFFFLPENFSPPEPTLPPFARSHRSHAPNATDPPDYLPQFPFPLAYGGGCPLRADRLRPLRPLSMVFGAGPLTYGTDACFGEHRRCSPYEDFFNFACLPPSSTLPGVLFLSDRLRNPPPEKYL